VKVPDWDLIKFQAGASIGWMMLPQFGKPLAVRDAQQLPRVPHIAVMF